MARREGKGGEILGREERARPSKGGGEARARKGGQERAEVSRRQDQKKP